MEIKRKELLPGVWLSCLQTNKFKSDCLSLSLLTQLERDTVSYNALVPRVLSRGTVFHPDMDSISAACDELYGARIIPVVRKKGEVLALGFFAGFIADRFTPGGEKLLESVSSLLGEMLLSPATRGGLLMKDYVESEKEKLIDDIRARINDKRHYAIYRLLGQMCAYEDYGIDDMGEETDVESINYIDLTKHYRSLLQECPIEIFYCGSSPMRRVEAAVKNALMALPRGDINYEIGTDIRMNAVSETPRYFEDAMDVTQGKLELGFRLGEIMDDPDFAAIRVFNALYGGTATSRLFLNVREKLSLCYYAGSSCDRLKGIMLVSSGIEFDKFEEAKAEILAQLDAIRKGEFTDEELSFAKKAVCSDLIAMTDSPGALEDFYLTQTLTGLDYGPEEFSALCDMVDRRDIIAVAKSIELDSVYFLRGLEEWEKEDADE
ncbi:MAG: insulinase family protein [Oscillospiraceae bacterium]|nr:insulinase family protein [Oscillospiraceae bacterium]